MTSTSTKNIFGIVDIKAKVPFSYKQILSSKALRFIVDLHLNFNERRLEVLSSLNGGHKSNNLNTLPHSLTRPKNIRNGELAYELTYRKIEVISPNEQDLIREAFFPLSGLFIVDFENKLSTSWENTIEGQITIKTIINNNLMIEPDENADSDILVEKLVQLMIHPRSLYLNEKNILVDKEPISAAFFDFGLFFFHNAKKLVDQGLTPYFYLHNIENHLEAKLWNDIFIFAEEQLNLPIGITKAAA